MIDYAERITSGHRKPRFLATVRAVTEPLAALQTLLESLRLAFDLDTATGVQLDAVGAWVGRSRELTVALENVYFSWDTQHLGWGEGNWQGLYDPTTGMVRLNDEAYRRLLRAKIAANHWDGTTGGALDAWRIVMTGTSGVILVQDNQDMTMSVGLLNYDVDRVTLRMLTGGLLPLKPEGVRVSWYTASVRGAAFAWDTDTELLAGWDTGSWSIDL